MLRQLVSSELVTSTGALPELARVGTLGTPLGFRLTLRIPALNGGAAIETRQMLLSMNFEESSMYRTCFGGSTAILSRWKRKEDLSP